MTFSLPGSIRSPQREPTLVTFLEALFLLLRKVVIEGRGAGMATSPQRGSFLQLWRESVSVAVPPGLGAAAAAQDTTEPVEVPVRARWLPSVS